MLDGEETRFESNILSQLTSIEKADQTALTFSYDPFGRLLVEKHLDVKGKNKKTLSTTRYLYLGYQEIGTLSSTGTIESLKIPGIHGDELSLKSIAFEIKGETYVPIHDIAGNVVRLIDPQNRQVIESYEYTAFGQVSIFNAEGEQEETSLVGNPWQFAEKRIDDKSGSYSYLDFAFMIQISADGLVKILPEALMDQISYAYLHNNPLNHLDRFGLQLNLILRINLTNTCMVKSNPTVIAKSIALANVVEISEKLQAHIFLKLLMMMILRNIITIMQ